VAEGDKLDWVFAKRQCMHCEEPACAAACIVGALRKTPEGPVVYDDYKCIGCRYCTLACPFGVPTFEWDTPVPYIRKCRMCVDRLTEGMEPGCAKACPSEAINYGERDELLQEARSRMQTHPDKYVDHIYGEHEVGGTSWLYISGVPFEQLGFSMDLGTRPYPELTRGFLSMVPAVLVIWPALLGGFYMFTQHREQTDKDEEVIPEKEEA